MYDQVEFDVPVARNGDCYDRYLVRVAEMRQSVRIIQQCLAKMKPGDVKIQDRKFTAPRRAEMKRSMEALIHHFKLVTEGFRVPAGQAYVPIESPRGELGAHVVSDGGTRPFRAHFRDPSFTNLQATSVMSEGGMVADVIVAIASIDPVMGGVDR